MDWSSRYFVLVSLVFTTLIVPECRAQVSNTEAEREQTARPPNIIILFADDLGYGDLSSYGHPTIRTPNLDRMGAEGIRMTSFYAAAPACTPSRAALLTGRYPLRSGLPDVLGPDSEKGLPGSEITLAEALKGAGYQTLAIGKWHLGSAREEFLPTSHGFDHYFGLLYSNDMQPPWVQTERPLRLYRDTLPEAEYPIDQSTLTERYTLEAIRFIHSAGDRPFFIYLAYSMPHLPISASGEFSGRSRAGLYGDVIETIDWSAGRILQVLEEQGLDDNTLIVFTSDNGPWLELPDRMLQQGIERWHAGSPGLLRGSKAMTYEGGQRVPGIVRWTGQIPAGLISAEIANTMDLYPTLLIAAGASLPDDRVIDGNDLMSLLRGEGPTPSPVFYYFRGSNLEAIRDRNWKLRLSSHMRGELSPELFDLDIDPSERFNVAERHPDIVNRLRTQLYTFAKSIEANVEGL